MNVVNLFKTNTKTVEIEPALDEELRIMQQILELMDRLPDNGSRYRTLKWAADRISDDLRHPLRDKWGRG